MIWITEKDLLVLLTILKGDKMEKYGVDKSSEMEKTAKEKEKKKQKEGLLKHTWEQAKKESGITE